MQLHSALVHIAFLIAVAFSISCNMNEEAVACASDNECPPSYYCAQSGGVFFASSQCAKRSTAAVNDDTGSFDATASATTDTQVPDTDLQPETDTGSLSDTSAPPETDVAQPPECTENAECDDNVSCTKDTCVDGFCHYAPDDTRCDDDNVCTNNQCDAAIGCVTNNNNAPCDDGVFCNGADLCANGTCSFHQGTTCPGGVCNESLNNCTECNADIECGESLPPVKSACVFDSTCTSNGTQTVTTRTPRCKNNTCTIDEVETTEPCTRAMPSGSCGGVTKTPWSTCSFDANICSTTGTQTRTITTPTCSNNNCKMATVTETQNCFRPDPIGACKPETESWGACQAPKTCDLNGTQHKSLTTWACSAGACNPTTLSNVATRPCSRQTDGFACTDQGYSGSCIAGCCSVNCPPNKQCLQCLVAQ